MFAVRATLVPWWNSRLARSSTSNRRTPKHSLRGSLAFRFQSVLQPVGHSVVVDADALHHHQAVAIGENVGSAKEVKPFVEDDAFGVIGERIKVGTEEFPLIEKRRIVGIEESDLSTTPKKSTVPRGFGQGTCSPSGELFVKRQSELELAVFWDCLQRGAHVTSGIEPHAPE